MSITRSHSRLKRIAMKAGAALGAAAVLVTSAGPALADTPADTDTGSTFTSSSQAGTLPGLGDEPPDQPPEDELTEAVAVVDQYWRNHFTEYFGGSYTPPQLITGTSVGVDGIYDGHVDEVSCGQEILVPDNAYYCPQGDFIAVDYNFIQRQDWLGDAMIWDVVAHEWGHAIQARLQPQYVPEWDELQADCFSGAALAGAAADGTLQWEGGDTDEVIAGLKEDADKTPWTNSADHGDPVERGSFFLRGTINGPLGCLP